MGTTKWALEGLTKAVLVCFTGEALDIARPFAAMLILSRDYTCQGPLGGILKYPGHTDLVASNIFVELRSWACNCTGPTYPTD